MTAASWVAPAIVAAAISALVTGFGWFISERHATRREAAQRRRRITDIQTAILAEIRAGQHRIGNLDELAAQVKQVLSEPSAHMPFVTRPAPSFVLNALLADIHVLPTVVIDPVVVYYRQMLTLALFVEDLRSERFDKLDPAQQRAMYGDYIDLLSYADVLADQATGAICRSLNISVAGQSDPLSAGAPVEVSDRSPSQVFQTPDKSRHSEDNAEPPP